MSSFGRPAYYILQWYQNKLQFSSVFNNGASYESLHSQFCQILKSQVGIRSHEFTFMRCHITFICSKHTHTTQYFDNFKIHYARLFVYAFEQAAILSPPPPTSLSNRNNMRYLIFPKLAVVDACCHLRIQFAHSIATICGIEGSPEKRTLALHNSRYHFCSPILAL